MSNRDTPAWLQAFAAVVALGISVWAALRSGAVERRRDTLQARAITLAIYPETLKLSVVIEDKQQFLTRIKENKQQQFGQSVAAEIQSNTFINVPTFLERYVDRFFLLGEPMGSACLQLYSILLQYNAFVDDIAGRITVMNAQQWPEAISHLDGHLDLLKKVNTKCNVLLRPIHDSIKG